MSSLSPCYGKQVHRQPDAGGENHPQPEPEGLRTEHVHPEVASRAARTGIRPLPAADDPDKSQAEDARHDQIAVAGFLLQQIRKILYLIKPFHIPTVYFFKSAANSLSCGSPSKKSTSNLAVEPLVRVTVRMPLS